MNNDPFVLINSVQKALTPSQQPTTELLILRSFYNAWKRLHNINGDKRNPEIRKEYETAAQELVDISHSLQRLEG